MFVFQIIFYTMSGNGQFQYPILTDREIIELLGQFEIPVNTDDLNKPETKKVMYIFTRLLSINVGISADELCVFDPEMAKRYGLEGNHHLLSAIALYLPL